jgi:CubicO group peptidase (beta-lactamase class C family)
MTNPISKFLQERIDANDFPSAVYLVAEKGEIILQDALGYAVVEPKQIPATTDTIYDLASLTKPLVTGLLSSKLIETETIRLEDEIADYLPGFNLPEKGGITIRNLLTHTSGFRAWLPFYLLDADDTLSASRISALVAEMPLENQPSEMVVYSDLNFLMLQKIIEEKYAKNLGEIAEKEIFERLALRDTYFNPPKKMKNRTAASEKGNEYEKQTCIEQGFLEPTAGSSDLFRDYQIWGEVHDGNAYHMGGIAGHAGLFSTAEEVFKLALQFLPNSTTLLKPETCELFRTNFTPGMNEARSIAFQLAETSESTAGSKMSPQSFGHLGFTGTSLWIDPVEERIFILLTNRTHAHPLPFVNINSVRRRFHDLANDLLDEKKLATKHPTC